MSSLPGIVLTAPSLVTLSLDGTLVLVEEVQPTFAAVVALPDQPTVVPNRVFTPGRVGIKKISPYSKFNQTFQEADLSDRNRDFLAVFKALRDERGPNFVQRTPEEEAAMTVVKAGPVKKDKTPRRMSRCAQCNEQPGHPNHPGDHAFVAPAVDATPKEPKAPVLCAACDEPEDTAVHVAPKESDGHKFIPTKKTRAPKAAAPADKPARAAKPIPAPDGKPFRWIGSAAALASLAAVNPKYKSNNSGAAIAAAIEAAGPMGADLNAVLTTLAAHDRWRTVEPARVAFAIGQLAAAKLIEPAV